MTLSSDTDVPEELTDQDMEIDDARTVMRKISSTSKREIESRECGVMDVFEMNVEGVSLQVSVSKKSTIVSLVIADKRLKVMM